MNNGCLYHGSDARINCGCTRQGTPAGTSTRPRSSCTACSFAPPTSRCPPRRRRAAGPSTCRCRRGTSRR
uniref:Gpm554 n=1 Tax=Arundo donax TaxID=35708 RepID=A0A0A9BN37_ARUDO